MYTCISYKSVKLIKKKSFSALIVASFCTWETILLCQVRPHGLGLLFVFAKDCKNRQLCVSPKKDFTVKFVCMRQWGNYCPRSLKKKRDMFLASDIIDLLTVIRASDSKTLIMHLVSQRMPGAFNFCLFPPAQLGASLSCRSGVVFALDWSYLPSTDLNTGIHCP